MTVTPTHCNQCGASTTPGFVLVYQDRRSQTARWVEGPVERSFFLGVRLRGRRKAEITALRCDSCGRVDLYAPAPA